jgi:hypothetical protein
MKWIKNLFGLRLRRVKRRPAEYQIAISHTCNSKKETIFKTRHKVIFTVWYWLINKYYKRKMFIWSRKV